MKDERPYFIKEEEHKILEGLAKDIFEELKKKEKVSVHADELKEKIIERIGEKIKEIKKAKEERRIGYGPDKVWKGRVWEGSELIWDWDSSIEDLLKEAKESFEEIYLFGRVKKFFMPKTGIGVIPDRDPDGNLIYVFYDTKWTFVKRQG